MRTFSTQRLLAAPPSAVFAALAQPERLARWWGPNGFRNAFEVFEFRTGGRWVFEDPAFAQAMKHILEPANEQNLDRLSCELGL